MRLSHSGYGLDIPMAENEVIVLVFERPEIYSKAIEEIKSTINGSVGEFVISDDSGELKWNKDICLIVDPFSVSNNERKITQRLYGELESIATSGMFKETVYIQSVINAYVDKLISSAPYAIVYDRDINISELIKASGVSIESEASHMIEVIVDFVKTRGRILNIKLFIFVNLHLFLSADELELLYRESNNEKVQLLLLEGVETNIIDNEKYYVMDKDLCWIQY